MLPSSGQISLSDVNTELGYAATSQITMNDVGVRKLMARNTNASEIGMNAAYGRTGGSLFTFEASRYAGTGTNGRGKFYSIDPNDYTVTNIGSLPYYDAQASTTLVSGVNKYTYSGAYSVANNTDTMCQLWTVSEYTGSTFVDSPMVFTSKDKGVTWTSTILPSLGYPYGVATNNISYVGNKFFILYSRSDYTCRFFYSTDGINWSYSNPPTQATRQLFYGIGFDGTYYRAYGQAAALGQPAYSVVSTDGVNWSTGPSLTLPIGNGDTNYGSQITRFQYGGGKWLLECTVYYTYTGINGTTTDSAKFFMHSSNGSDWTLSSGYPFYGNSYLKFYGSASYLGNNTWMCNCRDASYNPNKGLPFLVRYIRSTDGGATWTSTDCPGGGKLTGTPLTNLQFSDQWFRTKPTPNGTVYGGWGNYIYVSNDYGASWTQKYTITSTNGQSTRLPTAFF